MDPIDLALRRRPRTNSIVFLVLWAVTVVLIFFGAPFWSVILLGILGSYFALRDWRPIRKRAREAFVISSDSNRKAVTEDKMEISADRKGKDRGDAV